MAASTVQLFINRIMGYKNDWLQLVSTVLAAEKDVMRYVEAEKEGKIYELDSKLVEVVSNVRRALVNFYLIFTELKVLAEEYRMESDFIKKLEETRQLLFEARNDLADTKKILEAHEKLYSILTLLEVRLLREG